jgi:hypothetical protein
MTTKYFSVTYRVNRQPLVTTYALGCSVDIDANSVASYRHFQLCDAVAKAHWSIFNQKISFYDVQLMCVVDLTV